MSGLRANPPRPRRRGRPRLFLRGGTSEAPARSARAKLLAGCLLHSPSSTPANRLDPQPRTTTTTGGLSIEAWKGGEVPPVENDGILTAEDVSEAISRTQKGSSAKKIARRPKWIVSYDAGLWLRSKWTAAMTLRPELARTKYKTQNSENFFRIMPSQKTSITSRMKFSTPIYDERQKIRSSQIIPCDLRRSPKIGNAKNEKNQSCRASLPFLSFGLV